MAMNKAHNGIEYMQNKRKEHGLNAEEEVLEVLLHRYIETQDKDYWNAARALAKPLNLSNILGYLPYKVECVINEVAAQVFEEARKYYFGLENSLGFIPFNVRARVLLDQDDPALNEQIQGDNLATTQRNSVVNMLTKYYRTGIWNGDKETVHQAYQKHRTIFLEGCYRREDYY